MKSEKRRQQKRETVRSEILDAARAIVLERGYAALTMRRIAEAVEYSPAAIYQYFSGRDAIAEALSREGFQQLRDVLGGAASFLDLAGSYVRFGLEHPETYRLMFLDDPQITSAVLSDSEDPGQQCQQLLRDSIARIHSLSAEDLQCWADVVWTNLHGIVSLKLTCPNFPVTPVEVLVGRVCQMVISFKGS